jgi:hypothetical protein
LWHLDTRCLEPPDVAGLSPLITICWRKNLTACRGVFEQQCRLSGEYPTTLTCERCQEEASVRCAFRNVSKHTNTCPELRAALTAHQVKHSPNKLEGNVASREFYHLVTLAAPVRQKVGLSPAAALAHFARSPPSAARTASAVQRKSNEKMDIAGTARPRLPDKGPSSG